MEEIQPYIMKRSKANGFDFYHYLHINGCAMSFNLHAPVVKFIVSYLTPDEAEELNGKKMDAYCKRKKIPFGQGLTIEEAHADFQEKLKINPLK